MTSWFPPPSRPRPVDSGLKARSTRGAIAQTWWSRRFVEVLEGMGLVMEKGQEASVDACRVEAVAVEAVELLDQVEQFVMVTLVGAAYQGRLFRA